LIRWQTKYAFAIPLQEYVWSLMESTWKTKAIPSMSLEWIHLRLSVTKTSFTSSVMYL
jgi:hypothetical protein